VIDGSGRPKNEQILRIRVPKTASNYFCSEVKLTFVPLSLLCNHGVVAPEPEALRVCRIVGGFGTRRRIRRREATRNVQQEPPLPLILPQRLQARVHPTFASKSHYELILSGSYKCCGSMTFGVDPDPDRGSMSLTSRSGSECGSGSCYFHHKPSRRHQKIIIFLKKFFCILLFEGTFTSFFKDKRSKRSHIIVEIKVFLTIFAK
jgi:hypothetical protein